MKPALLIIDMQKMFYENETKKMMDEASEYINAAVDFFRSKNYPIVWIQHSEPEDGLVAGSDGFEWIPPLRPQVDDIHIVKTYGNAFTKTTLKAILDEKGVDTVILSGYCAEYCVLNTCRGAVDVDLTSILLRGSLASGMRENIKFVESINNIISYGAMIKIL